MFYLLTLSALERECEGERSAVITEKKVFGYGGWIFPRVALARAHHKCTLRNSLGAGEFSISGNGNDWNGLCNTSRWRWRQGATNFQLSDSSSKLDLSLVWSSLAGSQTEDRIGQAEVSFSLSLSVSGTIASCVYRSRHLWLQVERKGQRVGGGIDTPLIMNRFPSFNSVGKPRKFALPRSSAKKMLNHKMSFPLASNNLQLVFPPRK